MVGIVKQGSYYLFMITGLILGIMSAGAILFFGVGYIDLFLLFLAMFIAYVLFTLTMGYGIVWAFNPTNRQLIAGNIVLVLFTLIAGFALGKLLIG